MMNSLRVYPLMSQNNHPKKELCQKAPNGTESTQSNHDVDFYRKEIEKLMFAISTKESKVSNVIRNGNKELPRHIQTETSTNKEGFTDPPTKQMTLDLTRNKPEPSERQEIKKIPGKYFNFENEYFMQTSRHFTKDCIDDQEKEWHDMTLFCYKSELV